MQLRGGAKNTYVFPENNVTGPAYYFKGFDSPAENVIILKIGDYNEPRFEHQVKIPADFLVNVDWYQLIEFYKRHSLAFLLKDPVVAPQNKP